MNELIKVEDRTVGNEAVQTVNARELHGFLGVDKVFTAWIQDRIQQYGFVAGADYVTVSHFPNPESGNRGKRIDYHITIDMAKELSMVERNEKGKQARQYFLACEKRLKSLTVPQVPQTRKLPRQVDS